MILHKWIGQDVDMIPGLYQSYTHPDDWPYAPDWIVESVHLDTGNRVYWVGGHHRDSGEPFYWGHYANTPFEWRYDLRDATYQIGRHETPAEARKRVDAERDAERLARCLVAV